MARWIGIDFGKARTGLAFTDKNARIAFPHETVATKVLWESLESLVKAETCAGFVLGMPDAWSIRQAQETDSTQAILTFQSELQKNGRICPFTWSTNHLPVVKRASQWFKGE